MPQRSKVLSLPDDVKAGLDKRLISGGFSGYTALAAWLAEQGCEISRSSLQRYGSEFETRLGAIKVATEQARAVVEAAGDEAGVMGDALTRLIQEKLFQLFVDMGDLDPEKMDFAKVGRMVAELNRTAIMQKKWINEMKAKTIKTADEVVKTAKAGGLSAEKAEQIRKKILGIV